MDWGKFFAMGGYAFYVWASYALFLVTILLNVALPLRRRARLRKSLQRSGRRNP